MSAVELSRTEAVALVQRIMEADYVSEDEVNVWLDRLDRLDMARLSVRSRQRPGLLAAGRHKAMGRCAKARSTTSSADNSRSVTPFSRRRSTVTSK